ncbi:hypothetical protein AKJ16_DCAP00469 [Drosera capensis]
MAAEDGRYPPSSSPKQKRLNSLCPLGSISCCHFVQFLIHGTAQSESVVIIPAFGVQLETQYRSGRVVRRFVPCNSILKPVLNECVTPVTCYWSLAWILCDEDDLMLVFEELRPPLYMLVPVWKALCAGIEGKDCEANKSDLKEQ